MRISALLLPLLTCGAAPAAAGMVTARIEENQKVLDADGEVISPTDAALDHQGFASMVLFEDHFWLAYTEANCHGLSFPERSCAEPGARVRVLRSARACLPDDTDCDIRHWRAFASFVPPPPEELVDGARKAFRKIWGLGNSVLSVTPDGRLMLTYLVRATNVYPGEEPRGAEYRNVVRFTNSAGGWSEPHDILPGRFLWLIDVTWRHGRAWGIAHGAYTSGAEPEGEATRLLTSWDGIQWWTEREPLTRQATTEGTIVFTDDGRTVAAIRDETNVQYHHYLQIGRSGNPCSPKDLQFSVYKQIRGDGPSLVYVPGIGVILGARAYRCCAANEYTTTLYRVDASAGKPQALLDLEPPPEDAVPPDISDGAYPDFVWHNGRLYISYYAGTTTRSWIYTAKVAFQGAGQPPPPSLKCSQISASLVANPLW